LMPFGIILAMAWQYVVITPMNYEAYVKNMKKEEIFNSWWNVIKLRLKIKNKRRQEVITSPIDYFLDLDINIQQKQDLLYNFKSIIEKEIHISNYPIEWTHFWTEYPSLKIWKIYNFINKHNIINWCYDYVCRNNWIQVNNKIFEITKDGQNIFNKIFKCDKVIWDKWQISYTDCKPIQNWFTITTPDKLYILSDNTIALVTQKDYLHIINVNKDKIIINNPKDNIIIPLKKIKVKWWDIVALTKDNKLFVYSNNKVIYNQDFKLGKIKEIKDLSSDKKNIYVLIFIQKNEYIYTKINKNSKNKMIIIKKNKINENNNYKIENNKLVISNK